MPPSPRPVAPDFTLTSPTASFNGGDATATVSAKAPPPLLPASYSSGAAAAAAAAAPTPPLRVSVSDPQRVSPAAPTAAAALYPQVLLSTPHLSYLVAGDSNLPGFAAAGPPTTTTAPSSAGGCPPRSKFAVRRRFSDFAALRALLALHHRGYVVPPLPDKAFLDAKLAALASPPGPDEEEADGKAPLAPPSSSSFVAVRTADLAAFMRGVVEHPVLRESAALRVFVTHGDGPEWKEAAAAAEAAEAAAAASSPCAASTR